MAVTTVVGCQWGDEGKGKVVDLLSTGVDYVARFQGGPNAGHTVVANGEQTILHQIPSGILHKEVKCCLGNGCVVDPRIILEEIKTLEDRGIKVKGRLAISQHAHLIMPYHRAIDEAEESAAKNRKIGTTGKGIGPAYTDKYNRCGIRVVDLLAGTDFKEQLSDIIDRKNHFLENVYKAPRLDKNLIIEEFNKHGELLAPYISDVSVKLYKAVKEKKKIILEGAQGALLDIDHGTYPYVTSSNPTAAMSATGTGIGPRYIDRVVGVLKAYTTRVGNGPFPTELDGKLQSDFRSWGGEFGATTGRARRCGWLDLVIANYAARINSVDAWVITKLDVLSRLKEIKVCVGYRIGDKKVVHFPPETWNLDKVEPIYETLDGWQEDISNIRDYGRLPYNCRAYLDFIVENTGTRIDMVSVGPERDAIIKLRLR